MKEWSRKWKGSVQPRKQRKYRHKAPVHVRRKFLSVNLSPQLRGRYGARSVVVRKGDQVEVMRGSEKGKRGAVERVDTQRGRVYLENIKVKKADGSEVMKPVQASNVRVVSLNLDDKKRVKGFERKGKVKGKEEIKKTEKKEKGSKPAENKAGSEERRGGRK